MQRLFEKGMAAVLLLMAVLALSMLIVERGCDE